MKIFLFLRSVLVLCFVFGLVSIAACSHSPSAPKWYFQVTPEDNQYFYTVGSGLSHAQANQQALLNFSARFNQRFSALEQLNVIENDFGQSKSYRKYVNNDIEKIRIGGASIERQYSDGVEFYVSLRINKKQFYAGLNIDIDVLQDALAYDSSDLENLAVLNRSDSLRQMATLAVGIFNDGQLESDKLRAKRLCSDYDKQLEKLKKKFRVRIRYSSEALKPLHDVLRTGLHNHDLILSTASADLNVFISGKPKAYKSAGRYYESWDVVISYSNAGAGFFRQDKLVVVGTSVNGYQYARQSAIEQLNSCMAYELSLCKTSLPTLHKILGLQRL